MKNYHTHTVRCKHAIGSERDYIEAAIQTGNSELGFSDHAPWHYESSFHPTMRMEEGELEGYVKTLRALKEEYKDEISIKIGLEAEYFEEKLDWLKEKVDLYELDYLILGNHYDGSDETGIYYGHPLMTLPYVQKYVNQVLKAMDSGLFSYVAHPDVIMYDEEDKNHLKEMEKICIKAKDLDIPLEFNLLGFRTCRHYPSEAFFALAKKHGNKIIIGTDAHEPASLEDHETYDKAHQYLESLGLEITEDIRFLR